MRMIHTHYPDEHVNEVLLHTHIHTYIHTYISTANLIGVISVVLASASSNHYMVATANIFTSMTIHNNTE